MFITKITGNAPLFNNQQNFGINNSEKPKKATTNQAILNSTEIQSALLLNRANENLLKNTRNRLKSELANKVANMTPEERQDYVRGIDQDPSVLELSRELADIERQIRKNNM